MLFWLLLLLLLLLLLWLLLVVAVLPPPVLVLVLPVALVLVVVRVVLLVASARSGASPGQVSESHIVTDEGSEEQSKSIHPSSLDEARRNTHKITSPLSEAPPLKRMARRHSRQSG